MDKKTPTFQYVIFKRKDRFAHAKKFAIKVRKTSPLHGSLVHTPQARRPDTRKTSPYQLSPNHCPCARNHNFTCLSLSLLPRFILLRLAGLAGLGKYFPKEQQAFTNKKGKESSLPFLLHKLFNLIQSTLGSIPLYSPNCRLRSSLR